MLKGEVISWRLLVAFVLLASVCGFLACDGGGPDVAVCGDGIVSPPEQCEPSLAPSPGACPANCFYLGAPPGRKCVERCDGNELVYCGGERREKPIRQECKRSQVCGRMDFGYELHCLDVCAPGSPPSYCEGNKRVFCDPNAEGILIRSEVDCGESFSCAEDPVDCVTYCATDRPAASFCEGEVAMLFSGDGRAYWYDCGQVGFRCEEGRCMRNQGHCVNSEFFSRAVEPDTASLLGVKVSDCGGYASRCEVVDGEPECLGCPAGYDLGGRCQPFGACYCTETGKYACDDCGRVDDQRDACDFDAARRALRAQSLSAEAWWSGPGPSPAAVRAGLRGPPMLPSESMNDNEPVTFFPNSLESVSSEGKPLPDERQNLP